jgi:hypothetical protein
VLTPFDGFIRDVIVACGLLFRKVTDDLIEFGGSYDWEVERGS